MKPTAIALIAASLLGASCSDQYLVTGTSNVESLEGKTLYLKVFGNDDMLAIDSSRVIHGKFKFKGLMDSTSMANIFLYDTSVMPLVLEGGEVAVRIDETAQSANGTPLNDTLSSFIQRKAQIDARMSELPHIESQMIMDGVDHEAIVRELGEQARRLEAEDDRLVTRFIKDNYNNVLGPGVFMILTSRMRYPVMTTQIESIVTQAPPYFRNHPYVRDFIKAAESNTEKMRQY